MLLPHSQSLMETGETELEDRKTWRSTFYFMTGLSVLCFLGGAIYFDKDQPSTEKDR